MSLHYKRCFCRNSIVMGRWVSCIQTGIVRDIDCRPNLHSQAQDCHSRIARGRRLSDKQSHSSKPAAYLSVVFSCIYTFPSSNRSRNC